MASRIELWVPRAPPGRSRRCVDAYMCVGGVSSLSLSSLMPGVCYGWMRERSGHHELFPEDVFKSGDKK